MQMDVAVEIIILMCACMHLLDCAEKKNACKNYYLKWDCQLSKYNVCFKLGVWIGGLTFISNLFDT